MIYLENEQVIGFDCDDTLILHQPADKSDVIVDITDPYDQTVSRYVVHMPHYKLLKDRIARGCAIIVWSQSGPMWAKAVCEALKIEPTIVMGKPFMIVDDLPAEAWLNNRVYLKPDTTYGSGRLRVK